MTLKIDLLRPDDLLNLHIEGENLRIDTSQEGDPALVLEDASQPGYLVVNFPPQTVVEQAFYESSATQPVPSEASNPYNAIHPPAALPTPPVQSRIGGPSRLVFRIPAGSNLRIPYTTEGLLDWDPLDLSVSPLADVPDPASFAERQNAPAIAAPGRLETAVELPYRLLLSPNHAVAWLHARSARTVLGVTELWHTRMAKKADNGEISLLSRANPAPLRAIWSPDFNPNKFHASDPPLFAKPDADWGVLTPMTPSDRHEIVVLTSAFHSYVRDIDDDSPYEPKPVYAEQFMLSPLGGWLRSRGEWDPPAPFKPFRVLDPNLVTQWDRYVSDLAKAQPRRRIDFTAPVESAGADLEAPAEAEGLVLPGELNALNPVILTPLTKANIGSILWPPLKGETGDLLNMSEWTHIATLGRDHFVRIVYEGHLFPFGHRAALVKITERKIRDVILPDGSTSPLAYLVQRMFIIVRKPLQDYTIPHVHSLMEHEGLSFPFRSVRLTTLVTPDIADPTQGSQIPGTIFSFWVRLGLGKTAADDFKFHAVAEDIAGNTIDFSASLIFIPFSENQRGLVFSAYDVSGEERACLVPGQKVTFAQPFPGGANENTSLTTNALYFTRQPAPMNKTFGAFLPKLFKASVKLPAVEAMLGKPAETQLAYHDSYLKKDPNNNNGLFMNVVREAVAGVLQAEKLLSEFSADKAGGFATPDLSISGLTSKLGPLAGDLANAASDIFKPDDFFKDVKDAAKLFGTLNLADLLEPLTMTAGAPKIQFNKEDLPIAPPAKKVRLITTLDWTPEVHDFTLEIVSFHASRKVDGNTVKTKLEVHGRTEKVVVLPPTGPDEPATATMNGTLTDFTIEFLHVVEILFSKFAFSGGTGKKLNVTVDLDPETPVRFIEDLQFVEELRKTIPPGLFGDGPSLDINAVRVKAGFSLGLPPVSVAVFSLKDVTIAAFIELPFLDGRPLFDFSFSSREHPFNLTVAFLGGGGFFHLQLDTKGIKLLEAALEFGASASIDLGVASGSVHIMAGIYFKMERRTIDGMDVDAATLSGYLRMGGELSVLGLISVSLEFYLCFAYEFEKNAAYGRATLTVKVEVLFFSTSVEITIEKRFGGSGGDPTFLDVFASSSVWDEYAGAFA
ncbi:MAG TPA: hypothetical protein VMT46_09055 [Anaerolineaceae bacterium]|nr:hypothetical protein [Anaerolineaceae bacterium]